VAAAALGACGDDGGTQPTPPPEAHMRGTVTSIDDLRPIAGAEIFLVDDSTLTVAAGPARTDSFGVYEFDDPPVGTFAPLLFRSGQFGFDRSAPRVTIVAGDTVVQDFRVFESDLLSTSGGYKITGVVRDAETDEPIAGAAVSTYCCDMNHLFQGVSQPNEGFTDTQGEYLLESVPVVIENGMPRWLLGFGVSKEGYRIHYSGWLPSPTGADSTLVVNVDLERDGPTGAIYGRVLSDGQPVPNILVGLDVADTALFFFPTETTEKVPVLGKVDTTDANGRYNFSGLTPGFYSVDAAFRIGDGYVVDFDERALRQLTVSAGDSLEVPDSHLKRSIAPTLPAPRSTIRTSEGVLFRWEEVPTADSYRLWVTPRHTFDASVLVRDSTDWFLEFPGEPTVTDTVNLRWLVNALRADSIIGTFEEVATFTLIFEAPGK
jgi:hypothetical protein